MSAEHDGMLVIVIGLGLIAKSKENQKFLKGYLEKLQKLEFKQTARKTDLIGKIEESDLRRKNAKIQSNYANFTSTLSQISSTIASGVYFC